MIQTIVDTSFDTTVLVQYQYITQYANSSIW